MLGSPIGWIVAGGFFVLLAVLLASPVVIDGHVRKAGHNDDAELKIKALYGLLRYQFKVPFVKFAGTSLEVKEEVSKTGAGIDTWKEFNDRIDAEKVVSTIERMKRWLVMTRNLTGWVRQTLTKVNVLKWQWSTSVGTGDAMWTAMATGAIWSVKTSAIGVLSQMVHLRGRPELKVDPVYQHPAFATEWTCIAQIRFGYAILAGLQLLVRMKKWKGGAKAWQNILFKA